MGRAARNEGIKEWEALKRLIAELDPIIVGVYRRVTTDDSDLRIPMKLKKDDPEWGAPRTAYSDPTGDAATNWKTVDDVTQDVESMADHILLALNAAQHIRDFNPQDVAERARRTVPDCMACGDPIAGRNRAGFDEKCYKEWSAQGRPDRVRFIHHVKAQRAPDKETKNAS